MRTNRQFQALIDRAAKLAYQHMQATQELGAAFEERYGANYSDVDCDSVIDVCNVNGGTLTVADADMYMAECGHPKLDGGPLRDD